ncbi:hypothetical protein HOLleu_04064 [Holothuria leucospilota]|uniref:Uncharacterized protein n=1 Tax=Holothuria leucospilota TaxID=206669 RepID=A0A9Q1CTE1_HOLLE|nr:hypothetical protein HOLleu_04064 [Holothuria leucospilota]
MEAALLGPTTKDVRRQAYDFASQMGIKHSFHIDNKTAGYDWLSGFKSQHPELAMEAMNIARAVGFSRPQVQMFFDVHRGVLTTHEYSVARI